MRVVLGNRHAVHKVRQGREDGSIDEVVEPLPKGKRATIIDFPDGTTLGRAFVDVTHPQGVWASHTTEGATPAWVASDSPGLAALLAEHFGDIEIRDLEEN